MISQLVSYGPATWLLFVAVAFLAAFLLRLPGVLLGHLLLAGLIVVLDGQWIQSEMHKPGWDGQPDADFVFMIGVVFRIVLINTVLFPISQFGLRLRRRRNVPPPAK
jgi:hypothetical protein